MPYVSFRCVPFVWILFAKILCASFCLTGKIIDFKTKIYFGNEFFFVLADYLIKYNKVDELHTVKCMDLHFRE